MRSHFIFLSLEVTTSQSNPTIKRTVSERIDDTYNVCTADAMEVNDGPISSDDSEISLETQRPSPQVSDRCDSQATNFRPSADIPPDSASRPPERGPLLRWRLIRASTTTSYPALAIIQASRVRDVS